MFLTPSLWWWARREQAPSTLDGACSPSTAHRQEIGGFFSPPVVRDLALFALVAGRSIDPHPILTGFVWNNIVWLALVALPTRSECVMALPRPGDLVSFQ